MPKVSQTYLDNRRAEILDAALECFSREGFHRTTMQDIVEQSRLSPGAIYNYFASKEEIIEAIADERHARERQMIVARSSESALAALVQIGRDFLNSLQDPAERKRRRVTLQLWAEALRNPRVLRTVRRGILGPRKALGELVARAQKRGEIPIALEADAMARIMIAVFQGLILQLAWDTETQVEPYMKAAEALFSGLRLSKRGARQSSGRR
jgi:AcrR family transcriptional regulator